MPRQVLEARLGEAGVEDGRCRALAVRRPFAAFVLVTFTVSWTAFFASYALGPVVVLLGAFGPMAGAMIVTHWRGESVREWWRSLWRWHVPLRFYFFALGLPPLLFATTDVVLAAAGQDVTFSDAPQAALRYAVSLPLIALVGGGQEEPGWRGFALGHVQASHGPWRGTLLLGLVWGAWHLPVYGPAGMVGPMLYVCFYTWLRNRTGSVALCVLLHAGLNAGRGELVLADTTAAVDAVVLLTIAVAALTFVARQGRALAFSGVETEPLGHDDGS